MNEELNIAAILKEKPLYTKLWSPIFGDVFLKRIVTTDGIRVLCKRTDGSFGTDEKSFWENGKYTLGGEVCLFPSKQMHDWSKFAWKKGDVLICGVDNVCIFDKWANEDYTEFDAKYIIPNYSDAVLETKNWSKTISELIKKEHISKIEEIKGGKLNLTTLEIEKQTEFKDGDILHCPAGDITDEVIFIAKVERKGVLHSYIYMSKDDMIPFEDCSFSVSGCLDNLRPATDSEKQQLFDALKKEGKKWNPETLQIEDLPKYEFKAFDKVLVRGDDEGYDDSWIPAFFIMMDESDESSPYYCKSLETSTAETYKYCIPYNDQTAHLLGTTDEWKGGK